MPHPLIDNRQSPMERKDVFKDLSKEDLIERVRSLETKIADRKKAEERIIKATGKGILRILIGRPVYYSTKQAWAAWLVWLRSNKKHNWPEEETGNMVAAMVTRLFRIGLVGLIIALIPAATLVVQTFILSKQSKQLEVQNLLFERQTSLLAFEQTSRFRDMLYQSPIDSVGRPIEVWQFLPDSLYSWPEPYESAVDQLVMLAKNDRDFARQAIRRLVADGAISVSHGAFIALLRLGDLDINKDLNHANLKGIRVGDAQFSGVNLWRANLHGAYLINADFEGGSLQSADLRLADLSTPNFKNADLRGIRLDEAKVDAGNFENTLFDFASLNSTYLSNPKSLTINQLCQAYDLTGIRPDSLYNLILKTCPEKVRLRK